MSADNEIAKYLQAARAYARCSRRLIAFAGACPQLGKIAVPSERVRGPKPAWRGSLQRGRCPGATSALETLSLSLLSFSFWTRSRSASITPRDFRRRGNGCGGGGRLFCRLFCDREASTSEIRPRYAPSRHGVLARSLVHGFRDGRNESAGSRTTFLRLRRGAPSFRFRGKERESSRREGEASQSDAARSDAQV